MTKLNQLFGPNSDVPRWLLDAFNIIRGKSTKIVRVVHICIVTIVASLQINSMSETALSKHGLNYSKNDLLKDDTTVPLGRGVLQTAIRDIIKEYHCSNTDTTVTGLQRIDRGMRMIIRHIRDSSSKADDLSILKQIRENALLMEPPESTATTITRSPIKTVDTPSTATSDPIQIIPASRSESINSTSSIVPKIRSIRSLPMSPRGNQCMWNCYVAATGESKEYFQSLIRDTINSITDHHLLFELDFWSEPLILPRSDPTNANSIKF